MPDDDAQLGKTVVEALLTMVNGGPPITGEKADMTLEYISVLEYDEAAGRDRIEQLEWMLETVDGLVAWEKLLPTGPLDHLTDTPEARAAYMYATLHPEGDTDGA